MPRKASCKDLLSYFEVFTLKSLGEFFTKTFFFLICGILDYLDDFIDSIGHEFLQSAGGRDCEVL